MVIGSVEMMRQLGGQAGGLAPGQGRMQVRACLARLGSAVLGPHLLAKRVWRGLVRQPNEHSGLDLLDRLQQAVAGGPLLRGGSSRNEPCMCSAPNMAASRHPESGAQAQRVGAARRCRDKPRRQGGRVLEAPLPEGCFCECECLCPHPAHPHAFQGPLAPGLPGRRVACDPPDARHRCGPAPPAPAAGGRQAGGWAGWARLRALYGAACSADIRCGMLDIGLVACRDACGKPALRHRGA